jgi:MFS family permease
MAADLHAVLVQAAGFALVPVMPSVWSLTALYFIICFSYNFTNSAVFTSLGWMFPKRAGSALNLVLAMFGVGSFFIPLAAQACKHLLGSALAVFWVVAAVSLIASVPFFFVSSPKPPAPDLSSVGPSPFIKNKRIAVSVVGQHLYSCRIPPVLVCQSQQQLGLLCPVRIAMTSWSCSCGFADVGDCSHHCHCGAGLLYNRC